MTDYFNYLREMLSEFGKNFVKFFYDWIIFKWVNVANEQETYNSILIAYSGGFRFGGWLFWVIFLLLQIALAGAFVYGIVLFIRWISRYFRGKSEVSTLRQEIEQLNIELYQTIAEKDRILGIQVESLGIEKPTQAQIDAANGEGKEGAAVESSVGEEARFSKLKLVDEKYKDNHDVTILPEDAVGIDLEGICKRFRAYACSQMGLYYTPEIIRAFIASLGTSKIVILEGISGTGKTSLPYCFGRFIHHNAAICSVQPSWHDRSELLGYYNDFTKKFTETEFLRAVYEATFRDDLSIIVLDEMNLARVEYYFAEFLSIMEMPNPSEWNIDLVAVPRDDDPIHLTDGRLLIPQNIIFVGTANNDDSTFTITDKVYDRSMSIFFENKGIAFDSEFTQDLPIPFEYLNNLYTSAKLDYPLSEKNLKKFQDLDTFVIANFRLAFGNRIMKQLGEFVPCYVACGGTEVEAIDYMFCSKILKKFEVLNVVFLRDALLELDKELTRLFGRNEFQMSRRKIKEFLKVQG